MSEALISTKFKARGPWLLDSGQLQRLETAIEPFLKGPPAQDTGLSDSPATTVQGDATSNSLSIILSRGRELPAGSFKQAFSNAAYQHEVPIGFNYRIRVGTVQAVVHVAATFGESEQGTKKEEEELQIRVTPRSSRVSQELFVALQDWAEEVGPSTYQRWLLMGRTPAIIILALMLFVGVASFLSPSADPKEAYKSEAHKLLAAGVTQTNQQRAIEILLALQTDYNPPTQQQRRFGSISPTFLVIAIGLGIVAITPRVSLGFWKGKRRLRAYRWWMKMVPGAIPGLFFMRYALPQVFNLIERGFGH